MTAAEVRGLETIVKRISLRPPARPPTLAHARARFAPRERSRAALLRPSDYAATDRFARRAMPVEAWRASPMMLCCGFTPRLVGKIDESTT